MARPIARLITGAALTSLLATGLAASGVPAAAGTAAAPTLPELMRYIPPGQTQLITVQAAAWGRRDARLHMWEKRAGGRWVSVGTTTARLGSRGLIPGQNRRQDTSTTPSGRYSLPLAFGRVSSAGYKVPYRLITTKSYWCLDNGSSNYNRWIEQYPMRVCRPGESERLIKYPSYRRAVQIGYNLNQVRYRGGAIFLHDHGRAYTAGCVSIDKASMDKISLWLRSGAKPSIVIGTRASIIRQ